MPTPLIELQRRLALVGAIRAGGEKPDRGVGRKLEAWRLTSSRRALIEQAAALYGGDVSQWQSPIGTEWQCYTNESELPVLVMPNYSLRQTYELWEGATKRTRLCDGVEEELSGQACICNATGEDRCDLYTRLVVALPELDTALGWRVITRGINAAHELPAMLALIRQVGGERTFVPARLRLEQRRGVVDGQVTRFVVPTIDLGVGYLALAAAADGPQARELPIGTIPRSGPSLEQALSAVDAPVPPSSGRRAAAFGAELPAQTAETAPPVPEQEQTFMASPDMKTKLNVLVGTLRDAGHVQTDSLYDAIAKLRGTSGLNLATVLNAFDDEGTLHWRYLRDALTRSEAHQLIDWLVEKRRRVDAASAPESEPATQSGPAEQSPPTPSAVPFNEFPPGY